jgi:hypothetical protein
MADAWCHEDSIWPPCIRIVRHDAPRRTTPNLGGTQWNNGHHQEADPELERLLRKKKRSAEGRATQATRMPCSQLVR